jgi:hypothetical protein
MRRPVLLVTLAAFSLWPACGDDGPAVTPSTTTDTSSPGTDATPTSPGTLPGDIEGAIEAALAADSGRLEALLTTTEGPCVVDPAPGILRPPACPAGSPAGTKVPALVFGGCPDEFGFLDASITDRVTSFDGSAFLNHVIGVVDLGTQPMRYAALFGFEKVGWLGFDDSGALIGAGGGGDCPSAELRPRLAGVDWLTGPDWGD